MEVQSIEEDNVIQRNTSDGKYTEKINDDDNTKGAPTESTDESPNIDCNESEKFEKIIADFVKDLLRSFPEFKEVVSSYFKDDQLQIETLYNHCKKNYPQKFFDILYKKDTLITELNFEILPSLHIKELWYIDGVTETLKETIWKYLQLILFSLINDLDDKNLFGDTAKLFESFNQDDLKEKMESTMKDLFELFNENNETDNESDEKTMPEFLNPENVQEHLSSLLDGKLGKLASEIAEETANELDINMNDIGNSEDVMKKLMSNPGQLMNLVQKVGGKLDSKIKSGDIKESELMDEATEIMKKMQNMPGMKDMDQLLKSMGMPSLGKNTKINKSALNNQLRKQEAINRVRKKAQEKVKKVNEDKLVQEEFEKKRKEFIQQSGCGDIDGNIDIDKLMATLDLKNDDNIVKDTNKKKKKKKNKK